MTTYTLQPTAYAASPRWDGTGMPQAPSLVNNIGYDVTAPRMNDKRREQAYARANATVNNGKYQWPLFVSDITIDISLSGQMGQSRTTRDFYPHNFVMPTFTIQGQALDQEDYGTMCDFMHYVQQDSIANDGALLQLWIKGAGYEGGRSSGPKVIVKSAIIGNQTRTNQIIRGPHNPIQCQGYVNAMPRAHQSGVVSPTYTFSFMVAWMLDGIYQDNPRKVQIQQDWIALLKATSNLTGSQALTAQNNQVLQYAQNNSSNIFGGA